MHHTSHNLPARIRALGGLLLVVTSAVILAGCGDKSDDPLAKARREARRAPKSAEAQLALAKAYSEQGMHNDAFVSYRTAIELDPSNVAARIGLAKTDLELGNAEHAIKELGEVLKQQPDNADALDLLGRAYILRQDPAEAIKVLEKALAADPNHIDAGVDLVYAHVQARNKGKAVELASKQAARHAKSAQVRYTYGDVLLLAGRPKEAEKEFRAALSLDPNHAMAMVRLARVLLERQSNYEEVRKLGLKAAEIQPGDGLPAAMAAVALFKLGDIPEAISEMDAVCRANPFNPATWTMFAEMLEASGHKEEANLARMEALKNAPHLALTEAQREALKRQAAKAMKNGRAPYVQVDPRSILGEESDVLKRNEETNQAALEAAKRKR
ncbi:MAG: tetratricopeptide repeat protein [Armatimonadetes bacterium]|nr:tetratricopeptide repeat protein [Armatimonadota bacterium]